MKREERDASRDGRRRRRRGGLRGGGSGHASVASRGGRGERRRRRGRRAGTRRDGRTGHRRAGRGDGVAGESPAGSLPRSASGVARRRRFPDGRQRVAVRKPTVPHFSDDLPHFAFRVSQEGSPDGGASEDPSEGAGSNPDAEGAAAKPADFPAGAAEAAAEAANHEVRTTPQQVSMQKVKSGDPAGILLGLRVRGSTAYPAPAASHETPGCLS